MAKPRVFNEIVSIAERAFQWSRGVFKGPLIERADLSLSNETLHYDYGIICALLSLRCFENCITVMTRVSASPEEEG